MHQKSIAHRDIKPANILLSKGPRRMYALLTDFGISEVLDEKNNIISGFDIHNMQGASVLYAAPDVIDRMRKHRMVGVDPKIIKSCDIYSLSMVIVEMLTRKIPWMVGIRSKLKGTSRQKVPIDIEKEL